MLETPFDEWIIVEGCVLYDFMKFSNFFSGFVWKKFVLFSCNDNRSFMVCIFGVYYLIHISSSLLVHKNILVLPTVRLKQTYKDQPLCLCIFDECLIGKSYKSEFNCCIHWFSRPKSLCFLCKFFPCGGRQYRLDSLIT